MGTNMNDIALGSESLFILAPSSMAEVFIILRPSPNSVRFDVWASTKEKRHYHLKMN